MLPFAFILVPDRVERPPHPALRDTASKRVSCLFQITYKFFPILYKVSGIIPKYLPPALDTPLLIVKFTVPRNISP